MFFRIDDVINVGEVFHQLVTKFIQLLKVWVGSSFDRYRRASACFRATNIAAGIRLVNVVVENATDIATGENRILIKHSIGLLI